jgi:hypothetical protein
MGKDEIAGCKKRKQAGQTSLPLPESYGFINLSQLIESAYASLPSFF